MIEVKVNLMDFHEVSMFGDFLQLLEGRREADRQQKSEAWVKMMHERRDERLVADEIAEMEPLAVQPEITIEYTPAETVTVEEMEAATMAYLKLHGVPVTRALLDKYLPEPGKRVSEVPPEHWPALYAELAPA